MSLVVLALGAVITVGLLLEAIDVAMNGDRS